MPNDDRHRLTNGRITAEVLADGAELCSLRAAAGAEMIWGAGPVWPRHAPILFPIVGRLKGDRLRVGDQSYPMTQHGFARDRRFAWGMRDDTACQLVLTDDTETRTRYPFAFRLDVTYRLEPDALEVRFGVTNTGDATLPASIGAHPAFRWPLDEGTAKEAYRLQFAEAETGPVRKLHDGLLRAKPEPTPIQDRVLPLNPGLFTDDAIILPKPASRSVRYTAPGVPGIEVSWEGSEQLGIWSKAGGDFLCIEPWHGFASPEDFDGPFAEKPGLMLIPRGERRDLAWRVRMLPSS